MRSPPVVPAEARQAHRCTVCGCLLLRKGDVVIPGRRRRCHGCGSWVFTCSEVLPATGKCCPCCGRPVKHLLSRCPTCRARLRRGFWERCMRWLRGTRRRSVFRYVRLAAIRCRGLGPRRTLDTTRFRVLMKSIEAHGMLEPLVVRPWDDGYELVLGHRRFLAAHKLGLAEVPVIVRYFEGEEAEDIRLIESEAQELWGHVDFAEALERVCLAASPERRREILETLDLKEEELPAVFRILTLPDLVKDAVSLELIATEDTDELAGMEDERAIMEYVRERVATERCVDDANPVEPR